MENENSNLFQQNLNEIIVTCINQQADKKIYIKDVEQLSKVILNQSNLIVSNIQNVCMLDDQSQNIQSQYVNIQNQYKQKFYFRHSLRLNVALENFCLLASNKNNQNYTILGSDFKLQNLFPYQIDIYKKLILNEKFITQMVEQYLNPLYPANFIINNHIILLTIKLIQAKNEKQLFSEEEQAKIEKIDSILKNEQLKEKYLTFNNMLSIELKHDLQYMVKINEIISEYLNQKE
ncbi:zinc finger protein (macronuclear) [Tetrahymena thermophila SB210]|uniref:Zinc finger protein n=1 Tax=Tetrahymena thermophila (strain SB210) TaxID=312017 RepID=W7XA28_TETTS|nr:zinc finger protein [Tetrahymena thermophila SB210]EWS73258.1 zinc finger protein [Tetrahymena thermophila SB210]|eukprot:XP_012654222.1 zinc finger protein [Tetrahymena thermophila SB210]